MNWETFAHCWVSRFMMSDEINFLGYRFPSNKAVLICERVFGAEAEPEIIVHDFDGWLQCLSRNADLSSGAAKTVALSELMDRLPSADELTILHPGQYAIKSMQGWDIYKIEDA